MHRELRRVLAIPQKRFTAEEYGPGRTIDLTSQFALVPDVELYPIQSQALLEAHLSRGLVGCIGVGHGKTLISFLVGEAMGAQKVLLLVPSSVRPQTMKMLAEARTKWRVSPQLIVYGYGMLSSHQGEDFVCSYQPDLIVADEAHLLKHLKTSARTQRIQRYFLANHQRCRFVALSGTMLSSGIEFAWHLFEWALRGYMPLPRDKHIFETWQFVMGVQKTKQPQPDVEKLEYDASVRPLRIAFPADTARKSLRRRLQSTPGVVMTSESGVGASLREGHLRLNEKILRPLLATMNEMDATSQRPDGVYFDSPVAAWRAKMQMSLGWYYYWEWENDEPDFEYVDAHNEWAKQAYWWLFRNSTQGLDTSGLVARWLQENPEQARGSTLRNAHDEWQLARGRPGPRTVPACMYPQIIRELVLEAHMWCMNLPGPDQILYWYTSNAVAEQLDQYMHVVRAWDQPADEGNQALSIRAHGKGLNLQNYNKSVVLEPPSSAEVWEQLIGRTHRSGQRADTVYYLVAQHTGIFIGTLEKARSQAEKLAELVGPQRLVYADRIANI